MNGHCGLGPLGVIHPRPPTCRERLCRWWEGNSGAQVAVWLLLWVVAFAAAAGLLRAVSPHIGGMQ